MIELAKGLELPARAITESIAVLGRKGSGKTYTGGVLFEQMHGAGAQVVALDPVGNWWGLRLSKSGKRPGLPIPVFGGEYGDIPITPESGALLADLVVERQLSCVIDLLWFSKTKRKKFVTDFAERLYERKKRNRSPLHLFLEEARKFVPQRIQKGGGDERMLGAFEDIIRLGRNYGLGVTLIDQRPQSVNKEVLSQTEILIAHQLTHNLDHKQIRDWVSSNARVGLEALDELEELEPGNAFFWSPGLLKTFRRIKVRSKRTLDVSATPELGDGPTVRPRPLSQADLGKLKEQMVEVTESAKANDPRALRVELKAARLELEKLKGARADGEAAELKAAHREIDRLRGLTPDTQLRRDALAAIGVVRRRLKAYAKDLADLDESLELHVKALADKTTPKTKAAPKGPEFVPPALRPRSPIDATRNPSLTGPERRILDALAWWSAIGIEEPRSTAVAFVAGYSPTSGGFRNTKGRLRKRGLVEYPPGSRIALTEEGAALADPPPAAPSQEELHERVLGQLTGPQRRLLGPLLDAFPESMTADELADAAGYSPTSGGFRNTRGRLHTLELVEYPESGTVRAAEILFPGWPT